MDQYQSINSKNNLTKHVDYFFVEDFHEELFGDTKLRSIHEIRKAIFGICGNPWPKIASDCILNVEKYIKMLDTNQMSGLMQFNKNKHTESFLMNLPRYKEALEFVKRFGIQLPIEIYSVDNSTIYKIFDGSHRHIAACCLGIKKIPCLVYSNREIRMVSRTIFYEWMK